jgi:GT2 family glycosyltransferase
MSTKKSAEAAVKPVVSVCIVTYQARDMLQDCLHSLAENTDLAYEVIVVDNGSQDGVDALLAAEFPDVRYSQNESNLGYTRPMNQALKQGCGHYLLQLNPDTLILPEALDRLVSFMDARPEIGVCGPKVLNRDMTLQKSCRRGEPTPLAVFSYFLGLSARFPKSKFLGQYQLNYIDEDETHSVAGVSGSCMLIRREVFDQIGFLDERFFAYQEDADFCRRARQAGWQVYYYPQAQIIHFGGQGGSRIEPYRSIFAWHKAYFQYYRKHLARDYFFLFNWFYYLAMLLKLFASLVVNYFKKDKVISARRP